ncbi:MAG: diphosphate--fructose-6-phosphate 1-phosphotransferase [Bryobacterales bacterium]|nr:diphosphate--fructose-6-phosphate 1-phosphotransferase [Bryobacterales bacterium]
MSAARPGVALVAHSGGPTPVINASLLGVIQESRRHREITALYGARFGVEGILAEDFVDLYRQPHEVLEAIGRTPSSALGSSRRENTEEDLARMVEIFSKHNVRFFLYNGGNGSMGTAHQIAAAADDAGYELQVIGIPKTIDNDLVQTDHSPGYGSVARYFATAIRDIDADNRALPKQVEIVEVLGRNTGWLVAATALARAKPNDAPHLMYFPERRLPLHKFLADVEGVFSRLNRCVVAVCEGQLDETGEPFGADVRSGSRGSLAMNVGHRLAMLVSEHLKLRARSEKPGLIGRASSLTISPVDWNEACLCGSHAVTAAVQGAGNQMISLVREPGTEYRVTPGLVALDEVAYVEREVPPEWRSENDILPPFFEYAIPFVGEVPAFPRLDD